MVNFRIATPEDAPRLLEIYEPYVTYTAISFEYTVPTVEEFRRRIEETLKEYPYLLLVDDDGRILGYAYASAFHPRIAYKHCAEVSIYLDEDERGKSYGKFLYSELMLTLWKQNIYDAYACIAVTDREDDPHLKNDSFFFHNAMGFETVGRFESCGYKFGKWYNMVWMGRQIKKRPEEPEPFRPFPEIGYGEPR